MNAGFNQALQPQGQGFGLQQPRQDLNVPPVNPAEEMQQKQEEHEFRRIKEKEDEDEEELEMERRSEWYSI